MYGKPLRSENAWYNNITKTPPSPAANTETMANLHVFSFNRYSVAGRNLPEQEGVLKKKPMLTTAEKYGVL